MDVSVNGDELTIKVKLGKPTPSSTGKSMIRFSSGGFQGINGTNGLKVNLTVIQKGG